MRFVFGLVFLLGIGIAGFAVYMMMNYMDGLQRENAQLRERAKLVVDMGVVVVANQEIRYGMALKREHAQEIRFPKEAIPANAFTNLEDLFGDESTPPRAVLRTMEPGELIMATKVTRFGQDAGVASRLNAGMRAFTIRVDVSTGVSGFLNPGDRVDIYWTGAVDGRSQQGSKLILENIEVIAIDQTADEDSRRPKVARTVTVEVTPNTVGVLATAQSTGRLSMSLRGVDAEEVSGPIGITQNQILGIVETEAPQAARKCYTYERRGGQRIALEVPC